MAVTFSMSYENNVITLVSGNISVSITKQQVIDFGLAAARQQLADIYGCTASSITLTRDGSNNITGLTIVNQ